MSNDKRDPLGMLESIERRDFINGVLKTSLAVATSSVIPASFASSMGALPEKGKTPIAVDAEGVALPGAYPPALTGMRGSGYPGAFKVGHELRDGSLHLKQSEVTDTNEHYDLVVVGGGD